MVKTPRKERRESNRVMYIFIALVLYITLDAFLKTFLSTTLIRSFELLCVLFATILSCKYARISNISAGKILLSVVIAWQIFILLRGNFNLQGTKFLLKIISSSTLVYLLPIVSILPLWINFERLLHYFFYFSLLTIPLWLMNVGQLVVPKDADLLFVGESIGQYLPFFAAFLILFINRFNKKSQVIIWLIFITYLILMVLNARRNIMLSFGLYFIGYLIFSNKLNISKPINLFFVVCFGLAFVIVLITPDFIEKNFPLLFQRGLENTREGVEEYFLADFTTWDFTDKIVGKGLDATYYQPIYDYDTGDLLTTNRTGIETGYLDMILKGGYIDVLLIVILIVYSIIVGLKSRNPSKKRCAYFLMACLIDLYTTCLLGTVSVKSILMYVCIGICLSKEYPVLKSR